MHDPGLRQRSQDGQSQAEAAEDRRVPEEMMVIYVPDFMGNHALQLRFAQSFGQRRGKEEIAQPRQQPQDGGRQDLVHP